MEQRDIIKDQIEQVGKTLGKLIAKFLDLKTMGEVNDAIQVTNRELKEEIKIDVKTLLSLDKKDLKISLKQKHFGEKSLEDLSDYFRTIGESKINHPSEAKVYFEKAIELLELADEVSAMFSLNRMYKRKKLKTLIKEEI